MVVEEAICRKANKELKEKKEKDELILKKSEGGDDMAMTGDNKQKSLSSSTIVPRPLHRLFEVTHAFALSLQMKILSSQAEALRRRAWGGLQLVS